MIASTKEQTQYRDKIVVVGLGKLGSPMAACFAARGYSVTGVDLDPAKVAAINQGRPPVVEPGLAETILQGRDRLTATTDTIAAVAGADLIFVIVPTPSDSDGRFSLKYCLPVCKKIGEGLAQNPGRPLVVITSTVMPGDCGGAITRVLEQASGEMCGRDFGLCYSPEFIALGSVIRDFLHPDFYLIGESDSSSGAKLEAFYQTICHNSAPAVRMPFIDAELAKISVNSYVTMKITFANTLARVCEQLPGSSVDRVTAALGLDCRIGKPYLRGAVGYGGPCFPRDNIAFGALARSVGIEPMLAEATDRCNRAQVRALCDMVRSKVEDGARVAVLGLAYKPDTDVIEESQSVALAAELSRQGFSVIGYDPYVSNAHRDKLEEYFEIASTAEEALVGADIIIVATPWKIFGVLNTQYLAALNRGVRVVDCWRFLTDQAVVAHKNYLPIGIGGKALSQQIPAPAQLSL